MKKGILFLIVIILIPVVLGSSKGIILNSDFDNIYSVGDDIFVNFSIEIENSKIGFVEVVLDCNEESMIVYRKYQGIKSNTKTNFQLYFPSLISGECSIVVKFDDDLVERSEEFKISNNIDLEYSLNSRSFFPFENVLVNGSAVKKNGDLLEGVVSISIGGLVNKTFEVSEGKFGFNFQIDKNIAPGKYNLVIEAFEKSLDQEIINKGEIIEEIEIKSKPSSIEIEVEESINPPQEILIKPRLLDQAGNFIENESLIVKLFNPDRDIVFEKTLGNNEEVSYFFDSDALRGGWELNAYYGSIFLSKPIYLQDNEELSIDIVNISGRSHVRINNIGNIDYQGVVNVVLSNESSEENIPINVDLEVGEVKSYEIDFKGYYNLSVSGSDFEEISFENVYLTGAAVFSDIGISLRSYVIFLIIIIVIVVVYFLVKKGFFNRLLGVFKRGKIKRDRGEKRAYICFFQFKDFSEDYEKIIKKSGYKFNKIKENLYYALFYDYSGRGVEKKLFNLASELREKAKLESREISIVINSWKFENKVSFLKNFALISRKLVHFAKGKILVTKPIFENLKVSCRETKVFRINEKVFQAYVC